MKTILQSLTILTCCVLSATAYQAKPAPQNTGKSKPPPPAEAPIPAYLKAAASDMDVFLEFADRIPDSKELQAHGQKYLSASRQAEDDGIKGDRFKAYQQAALSVKIGMLSRDEFRYCNEFNKANEGIHKQIGRPDPKEGNEDCTHTLEEMTKSLREAREWFDKARH